MATWEEIRALQSDLEKVQLGASAKKLSERNMVEVRGSDRFHGIEIHILKEDAG